MFMSLLLSCHAFLALKSCLSLIFCVILRLLLKTVSNDNKTNFHGSTDDGGVHDRKRSEENG